MTDMELLQDLAKLASDHVDAGNWHSAQAAYELLAHKCRVMRLEVEQRHARWSDLPEMPHLRRMEVKLTEWPKG